MDINHLLIKLAKNIKYQNLFTLSKDLRGVRLFRNTINFSKLQESFLCYLYTYDSLYRDIAIDNISKKVLDDDTIYMESYLIWKKKKDKKNTGNSQAKDLKLVSGKKINFNKGK